MRTLDRDRTGIITASAHIADAASGSGIAYPGVPFTFVRTTTGQYSIYFDPAFMILSSAANADTGGVSFTVRTYALGPGPLPVLVSNAAGTLVNGGFNFTVTLRDTRR